MVATNSTSFSYDCIIVGAGHNGLICAAYLAKAGKRVLVLEAASQVGGAASTHSFAPGFSVSTAAHLVHLLPEQIVADLGLGSHGLSFAGTALPSTAIGPGGVAVDLDPQSHGATHAAFIARMTRLAGALGPMLSSVPPRLGTDRWSDRIALLKLGWQIRRLGRKDMRELLRIIGMNVYDLLKDEVASPELQGALAFDATLGANLGPRAPGTVLTWLYRLAHQARAAGGGLAQPTGGLGGLTSALAKAATAAGARIETGAPVERVLVAEDRVVGVALASGREISAPVVVSNADPKTTFLKLLGTGHLDTGFVRKVHHARSRGLVAKLNLALNDLPRFTGVDPSRLRGRLVVSPTMDYLERAFDAAKYREYAAEPALEITIPTVNDPSLAPAGKHVLSALVECAPYDLKGGWDAARDAYTRLLVDRLDALAPGLKASVVSAEFLAPTDFETRFGNAGGHWHHVDLAFDQFYFVRPVPGAAQYTTPMAGLYLCGAGAHPGGGVAGIPGRLAAQAVLAQAG